MVLFGLLGVAYWILGDSSGHGADAAARTNGGAEATARPPEVEHALPESRLSQREAPAVKRAAKGESVAAALAQRPPALTDPRTEISSDPARQRRYSERAARAERLNQRLKRRIEELEDQLATSSGEQSAIRTELQQLRANLSKRQELERAAMPARGTRAEPR